MLNDNSLVMQLSVLQCPMMLMTITRQKDCFCCVLHDAGMNIVVSLYHVLITIIALICRVSVSNMLNKQC